MILQKKSKKQKTEKFVFVVHLYLSACTDEFWPVDDVHLIWFTMPFTENLELRVKEY